MRRSARWTAPLIFLLVCGGRAAKFPHFSPSIRDFIRTDWTQFNGTPLADVTIFEQTSDGHLLFNSAEGWMSFDGVRFVRISPPCNGKLFQVRGDGSGGFWFDCGSQLFHRDASGITAAIQPNPLPRGFIANGFFEDSRKNFWFYGESLACLHGDGSGAVRIRGAERSENQSPPGKIEEDAAGTIWLASEQGLFRVQGNRAEHLVTGSITSIAPSPEGGIIFLTNTALRRVREGVVSTIFEFPAGMSIGGGPGLAETPAGIWFGTRNMGVALLHKGTVETFGRQDGLSSDSVSSLRLDGEGDIWVGTSLGLHRFRVPQAYLMSQKEDVPAGTPTVTFRDHADGLWIGSTDEIRRIDKPSGKAQSWRGYWAAIGEDGSRVWLARSESIGHLEQGRFVGATAEDGHNIGSVNAFGRDDCGHFFALSVDGFYRIEGTHPKRIATGDFGYRFLVSSRTGTWIALAHSGLMHIDRGQTKILGPQTGIADGVIFAITEIGDSVWVGTREGLSRFRNGKWTTWTPARGLPGRGVFEIIPDEQGRLWLMTYGGILVMDLATLAAMPDGRPQTLGYLRIGYLDRVMPHRGGIVSSPRVTKDAEGRIYFDTFDGVAVVDPRSVGASKTPTVMIDDFLVNRRRVGVENARSFTRPDDLQFEFTAPTLRAPENLRFRYKLENYDEDWMEAGSQRRATYGAMPPGSYRFRVTGYGEDDRRNNSEASLEFSIVAPFYQRMPFVVLTIGTVSLLLWIGHRYRVRVESYRVRLTVEAQTSERLRIAHDMHDNFLQTVYGSQLMLGTAVKRLKTEPDKSYQLLEQVQGLIEESAQRARETITAMKTESSGTSSFSEILKIIAQQESRNSGESAVVSVDVLGTPREFKPGVQEQVNQIACEALRNALRHSMATFVRIEVRYTSTEFDLHIEDDGIGIDPRILEQGRPNHFGLTSMRERAQRIPSLFRIESLINGGTKIRLTVPSAKAYLRVGHHWLN